LIGIQVIFEGVRGLEDFDNPLFQTYLDQQVYFSIENVECLELKLSEKMTTYF